jgi:hypothetical protein
MARSSLLCGIAIEDDSKLGSAYEVLWARICLE